MYADKRGKLITLAFNPGETRLLRRVLLSLITDYSMKPAEIDSKVAQVWYSTRGCSKMSAEDVQAHLGSLHEYKSTTVAKLQKWVEQLNTMADNQFCLSTSVDQAPDLISALNDYRLASAARHDIGQAEMDLHSLEELGELVPLRRAAVFEIHFLAYVIEELLRLLPGNYSDWQEFIPDE